MLPRVCVKCSQLWTDVNPLLSAADGRPTDIQTSHIPRTLTLQLTRRPSRSRASPPSAEFTPGDARLQCPAEGKEMPPGPMGPGGECGWLSGGSPSLGSHERDNGH